jgi:hypothetical protein
MISFSKYINFDILRVNAEQEDRNKKKYTVDFNPLTHRPFISSGYRYIYDYIYIENFCKAFGLIVGKNDFLTQKTVDFAYLLLLLGDDFIPVISTIDIKSIDQLWNTYNELIAENKNYSVIEITGTGINTRYKLNYNNLILYFNKLSTHEQEMSDIKNESCNKKLSKHVRNINNNFSNVKKIHNLDKFLSGQLFAQRDIDNIKKYFLFNEGIVDERIDLLSCSDEIDTDETNIDNIIIEYLRGCKFVFDIYFNNDVPNYKWYYPFEKSPMLAQISRFLSSRRDGELEQIFANSDKKRGTYFNLDGYKKYIAENTNNILLKFMMKICIHQELNTKIAELEGLKVNFDLVKFEALKRELLTYDNVKVVSHCINKERYSKCFEPESLLDTTSFFVDNLNPSMMGGKYKQKFEKYTNKINKL